MTMRVVAWIDADTWPVCVTALRAHTTPDDDVRLVHVADDEPQTAAAGALAGLLGRGAHTHAAELGALAAAEGAEILADAAAALGRPARLVATHGRVERELLVAAADADLLVLVRDGGPHPGPHSLGRAGRFVVDHATCAVLLVTPTA